MQLGFNRLRFLIAFIFLFAAGLKYYQLITEPIPLAVQNSFFTPFLVLTSERYFIWFVIEFELCLGLILLFGVLQDQIRFLSLFCFLFFSAISFLRWISGESSCGCFGTISVNPLYTMFFDITVVALIVLFRGQMSIRELLKQKFKFVFSISDKKKLIFSILVWLILSLPISWIFFSIEVHYDLLGERAVLADGREKITLIPQNWQNKKFPLIPHLQQPINKNIDLKNIRTIILIHSDCPRCKELSNEFENQEGNNIILVEVPSKIKTVTFETKLPVLKLDDKKDWFAVTPCVINLQDGICVTVNEY
ncbi:MAG: hypothetical protein LBJ00_03850 [Planctomycetaceae bacterium]|jgi:hypothetical protein|nr:hypothetical protein [Planctomycetaceae bacterium]